MRRSLAIFGGAIALAALWSGCQARSFNADSSSSSKKKEQAEEVVNSEKKSPKLRDLDFFLEVGKFTKVVNDKQKNRMYGEFTFMDGDTERYALVFATAKSKLAEVEKWEVGKEYLVDARSLPGKNGRLVMIGSDTTVSLVDDEALLRDFGKDFVDAVRRNKDY